MLRIISLFLLLIISRFSFADTIPATKGTTSYFVYLPYLTLQDSITHGFVSSGDRTSACKFMLSSLENGYSNGYVTVPRFGYLSGTKCYYIWSSSIDEFASNLYINLSTDDQISYSCPSGYYHSDSLGSYNSIGAFCSSCAQSPKQNLTDLYLTGSTSGCYQECSFKFSATAEATATLAAGGQVFGSQTARCSSTTNGAGVATSSCTGPMLIFSGSSCEPATSSAAAGASLAVDDSTAEIDMTDGSCPNGVSTGQFNGSRVIFCKAADSTGTTSGASDTGSTGTTSGASGTDTGSTGTTSGASGTDSGGSSSSGDADDTSSCDAADSADCAGTGSGGSFSAPGKGTDYLKDVFGESDLAALAADNTELTKQINQKMSEVKSIFNLGVLSVSGNLSENKQEINGASVDLSGRNIFERFSIVSAAFYLCAVASAIYIVMGGKK